MEFIDVDIYIVGYLFRSFCYNKGDVGVEIEGCIFVVVIRL